jgi:hypothetical protein
MERRQIHGWNHTAGCGAMSIHNVTFFYRQYKKLDETDQGIWDGRRERPGAYRSDKRIQRERDFGIDRDR